MNALNLLNLNNLMNKGDKINLCRRLRGILRKKESVRTIMEV